MLSAAFEQPKDVHMDGVDSNTGDNHVADSIQSFEHRRRRGAIGRGPGRRWRHIRVRQKPSTQCYDDGCYRVRCNDYGDDCVNIGYVERADRPFHSRYVCDAYGDDCRWTRVYDYDRDYPDDDYGY